MKVRALFLVVVLLNILNNINPYVLFTKLCCVLSRIMKAQTLGDNSQMEFMRGRRILEINPTHPIIQDLNVCSLKLLSPSFCWLCPVGKRLIDGI